MSPRDLIRDERGFSLMELLMAMALGSIVLAATLAVFTTGLTATGQINDRIDTASRGRAVMDRITTLLDAQVCLRNSGDSTTQPAVAPIVGPSSTATSITFYADLGGASDTPNKYTITYTAGTGTVPGTLTLYTYKGVGTLPSVSFATTPTVTQLASSVQASVVSGVTQPVFKYYVFSTDGSVNEAAPVTPSALNQLQIVRVGVQFQANSTRNKKVDARRTIISGEAVVATADPNDPDLTACAS